MKRIFTVLCLFCATLYVSADLLFSDKTEIDDLALIYIGSQHRPDWNKELFEPYVVHTYPDGKKSWMFDGFLMIEFKAYNKLGLEISFGESVASVQGSKKEDWERLLHEQLGTYTGNGCRALDNLIGELIPELGQPGHKHKVVFSLPVAEVKSDIWGVVDGRKYDFTKEADRIDGMKWYADLIVSEWEKAGFKNLELDGVYWTKETFDNSFKKLAQDVNRYYHDKELLVYWIPYLLRYNAVDASYHPAPTPDQVFDIYPDQPVSMWEEIGIDVVYLQPNYYFQTTRPLKTLTQTIDYADKECLGLEIEFEGYNFTWTHDKNNPETGVRSRILPSNAGMYGHSPTFYNRLKEYIDQFEAKHQFDMTPLSYYSGFEAVYDFEKSGNPKDKEIINRLATIINKRHQMTHWDKAPSTSGIDDIAIDNSVLAYGVEGGIYIAREGIESASVYSIDGTMIYSAAAIAEGEEQLFGVTVPCEKGVYIVRVGGRAIKVLVK